MFDENSFTDEITTGAEAKAAVAYLAHNEIKFRKELASEGVSYAEMQNKVGQVWRNLLKSCKRVKYSDFTVQTKMAQYGVG